jgi:hypothetical protein
MLVGSAFRGSAVSSHFRVIWSLAFRQVRQLDRRLRPASGRRHAWLWVVPIASFVFCASILVLAGVLSGVWAAEYIPTALFESLVIAGLFFVCIAPVVDGSDNDNGDRGPDKDPVSSPPPFDPTVWVPFVVDPAGPGDGDRPVQESMRRELVETRR